MLDHLEDITPSMNMGREMTTVILSMFLASVRGTAVTLGLIEVSPMLHQALQYGFCGQRSRLLRASFTQEC